MSAQPNAKAGPQRQSSLHRRLLVLVAMLVAGFLGAWAAGAFHIDGWRTSLPTTSETAESTETERPDTSAEGSKTDLIAGTEQRHAAPPPSDPATGPVPRRVLSVRCVDTQDATVAGALISYQVSLRQYPSSDGVARSDRQGCVKIDCDEGDNVRLESADDAWYFRAIVVQLDVSNRRETVTLTLRPAVRVRIRAAYDDGQPVTYMGSLHSLDMTGGAITFGLSSDGTADVPRVPVDEPLKCLIFGHQRGGYGDATSEFQPHELASGQELLVLVRRLGETKGHIRAEFGEVRLGHGTRIIIEQKKRVPLDYEMSVYSDHWVSPALIAGSEVRLSVLGQLAWQSDWITVEGGREIVVKAVLVKSGGVKARILDAAASPVRRGALRLSDGGYLAFVSPGNLPIAPEDCWSDDEGAAQLLGLPPGKLVIEAWAWGKEPAVVEVEIRAGLVLDLGNLILVAAQGTIELTLEGVREGFEYVAFVIHPGGGRLYPPESIAGDSHTIRGLPVRNYQICITLKTGGRVVSQPVSLSQSMPNTTVRLNVANLSS